MFPEELIGIATELYEAGNLDKLIEALETERLKKTPRELLSTMFFLVKSELNQKL